MGPSGCDGTVGPVPCTLQLQGTGAFDVPLMEPPLGYSLLCDSITRVHLAETPGLQPGSGAVCHSHSDHQGPVLAISAFLGAPAAEGKGNAPGIAICLVVNLQLERIWGSGLI